MPHRNKQRPQALNVNTTEQLFEYLDRFEAKLDRIGSMIAGSQRFASAVALSEYRRDLKEMAEFSALNARVSKLSDLTASIKTMADGLKGERDALKAELDALKAADALDQGAVDATEAKLAEVTAALEALTAVATGTPAEPSLGGT